MATSGGQAVAARGNGMLRIERFDEFRVSVGARVVDGARFVSFGRWENGEVVGAWKASPEFRERIGRVLQHVEEFVPTELDVIVTATPDRAQQPVQTGAGA